MAPSPLRLSLALVLAATVCTGAARADFLTGTRTLAELFERAHSIDVKVDRDHATLVVRRTFENLATKSDQAVLFIEDLPSGAVATALRTQGDAGQWFEAELLEASLAEKRYRELTGVGIYKPRDPALLYWHAQGELRLQVFPVPANGKKTVEYTLQLPTTYAHGRFAFTLPAMGVSGLPATATFAPASKDDALRIDGSSVIAGEARRLLGHTTIELAPAAMPKLGGSVASVGLSKDRALFHASIEAGARLSEPPKGAYVVVLLDGSRSLDDDQRAAAISATSAYLAQLPDAKVQIASFDRYVRPIVSTFVPASDAIAALRAHKWIPKNGSAIDLAFEDAKQRIEAAPAGAPRRVLMLTDLLTSSAIGPSRIKGLDAMHAVVHVSTIRAGHASLARDDGHEWAQVPRATGGVLWHASAEVGKSGSIDGATRAIFEEWVRPLRIDALRVKGLPQEIVGSPGSAMIEPIVAPEVLDEGEGWSTFGLAAESAPTLEVTGELWSTPVKTTLASTSESEKRWSAFAFGSTIVDALTDKEMMTLATKGGAVSPVTSYLAIEPGVRPSTDGLVEPAGVGGIGFGLIGHGAGGGGSIGCGLGTTNARELWLRERVREAAKACGGEKRAVRVVIETTRREIVSAIASLPKAQDETLRRCVEDHVWELDLPAQFSLAWEKSDVSVGGG